MIAPGLGSRHDPYRERLTALATDTALRAAIVEAGQRHGWWSADRTWVRTFGRFYPDRDPFATLVFQSDGDPQLICQVEVFETRPAPPGTPATCLFDEAVGWLCVAPFPSDPALPKLSVVLAHPGRRTVVRYRPGSRCTIRFEGPEGRLQFAKVFRDDTGERSHANSFVLWQAACHGELEFAVARPERWDAETRTLWQEGIPGIPVTALRLAEEGTSLAHRMGRAAASLTQAHVKPRPVYDWRAHLARSVRHGENLSSRVPRLAQAVDILVQNLSHAHATVGLRRLWPIHGSLSRTQWVDGGSHLGLVDFDKLALGDPEFDVAAFLTQLDFDRIQVEQIKNAFLSSYESIAGPLDRRLLNVYRAHQRLAKALTTAWAVRPDGDMRAEQNLESALACSAETPI